MYSKNKQMVTLDRWIEEKKKEKVNQKTLNNEDHVREYRTLSKAIREDPELKEEYQETINKESKQSERDTTTRINEHGFFFAEKRTDDNEYDKWDIGLAINVANNSKLWVGYIDNEWRQIKGRKTWDANHPSFPFGTIDVPVEKIEYFDKIPEISFYIPRAILHEDGIGCVIKGAVIVDYHRRGKIESHNTRMGKRDFITIKTSDCVCGKIEKLVHYMATEISKTNNLVKDQYTLFLNKV